MLPDYSDGQSPQYPSTSNGSGGSGGFGVPTPYNPPMDLGTPSYRPPVDPGIPSYHPPMDLGAPTPYKPPVDRGVIGAINNPNVHDYFSNLGQRFGFNGHDPNDMVHAIQAFREHGSPDSMYHANSLQNYMHQRNTGFFPQNPSVPSIYGSGPHQPGAFY